MLLGIIALLWALFFGLAATLGQQPQVSAYEVEYDTFTKSTIFRGEALFTHEELRLSADQIRYFPGLREATATGNVSLNYRNLRLVGEELSYRVDEKEITSDTFMLGFPPIFAEGKGFSGTPEKIEVGEVTLYFQEPTALSLNVMAKAATIYPDDRIEASGVTFRIGDLPIFYLPRYTQRMEAPAVQLDGKIGYRNNLGAFFRSESLFPVSRDWKIGANIAAYTKRGFLIGPSIGWESEVPSNTGFSEFESGYIHDTGERGIDILGVPIDPDRYFLELTHKSRIRENLTINAQISAWSDSEVLRDFRPDLFRDNQQPDHFVEAVYRKNRIFISTFARFAANDFHPLSERLPEFRFDFVPSPLFKTGFYHSFNAGYARLKRDDSFANAHLESDRIDFHYSLQRPTKINQWLHFVPLFGGRSTHYVDTVGSQDTFTRNLGEIGLDAEIKAYAVWEYRNERWGIDGLRHILRPIFRYRYLPGGGSGQSEVIPIDTGVFSTSLPPIDLGNIRGIDDLSDLNVIRFGLENLLQTRHQDYGSRNLVELNFYQDLLFSAEPGERNWSDFFTQLSLTPIHWLQFDLFNRINPEALSFQETRTRLTLNDSDIWTLSFSSNTLRDIIEQYEIDFLYKLNERWIFRTRIRLDARKGEFTEQVYAIRHRLPGSWELEFQIALHEGSSREGNVNFNLRVSLLQF